LRIFIITEGNLKIGYGHLSRCLALYQGFSERLYKPKMIVNCDQGGMDFLGDICVIKLDWLAYMKKLAKIISQADIVIIDSYLADKNHLLTISKHATKPVFLDDTMRLAYPSGIIINGAVGAENLTYTNSIKNKSLLGLKYAPIREEFWDIESRTRKSEENNILIALGGNDRHDLTGKLVAGIHSKYPHLIFHVVTGQGAIHLKSKKNNVYANTLFYKSLNGKGMFRLMSMCKYAISSAGQTMYELARIGVPTIGICMAENQLFSHSGWVHVGFTKKVLWYYDESLVENTVYMLADYLSTPKAIPTPFFDGQGVRRIVSELV
jgi:UDP-2,4-diacetamido-2,4,6-trideoxy-beta-L-altropyranose hydrolase